MLFLKSLVPNKLTDQKAQIRNEIRTKRRQFSNNTTQSSSAQIVQQILRWQVFEQAQTIMIFAPLVSEPDLLPLVALLPDKRFVFPRMLPEKNLEVRQVRESAELIPNTLGIAEPHSEFHPLIKKEEIDLFLIPALAVDLEGNRLGFGGGYYDRFLPDAARIATIVFAWQILPHIPHENHDKKVDFVISEAKIFSVETR